MIKTIEKETIQALPPLKFKGQIELCRSKKALVNILKELPETEQAVGFDTESRPSFKKGIKYPVSLVQLASRERALIIQIKHCGFPKALIELFENDEIAKVGIGIRDDIRDLQNIATFKPNNFIDLNEWAPKLGFQKIGARNLAAMILGGKISKQQQTSNWAIEELTPAQIDYAATDAWICAEIYHRLKDMDR